MTAQPDFFDQTPKKKPKRRCPNCGAAMNEHKHTLSRNLVVALARLARHPEGGVGVNLKDLALTRNQWDNFQKLRYWGLVAKTGTAGCWRVTEAGWAFLAGKAIDRGVWTYRGQVQRTEPPTVVLRDVVPEYRYRTREDYAADAEGHDG